jgi:Na+(H+)/acetate symporter ActP
VAVAFRHLALYTMPELLGERYGLAARRLASFTQLTRSLPAGD